jgi:RsmE family RNA methyltransferase
VTAVAVGPEGGWSPDELAIADGTAGLGPYVLRAETAALVAGAILAGRRASTVVGEGR